MRTSTFRLTIIPILLLTALSACSENNSNASTGEPDILKDMTIGQDSAPITIIEYASMTCNHCAQFHRQTLPKLKQDYINTGQVKLIFREFPLDPWATAASLLARCAARGNPKRFFSFIDILFQQQEKWVLTQDRMNALQNIARQAGVTQTRFNKCFDNEKILQGLSQKRQQGVNDGVNATPSFLINGTLLEGNQPYDTLKEIINANAP